MDINMSADVFLHMAQHTISAYFMLGQENRAYVVSRKQFMTIRKILVPFEKDTDPNIRIKAISIAQLFDSFSNSRYWQYVNTDDVLTLGVPR
jgi:hypothetical protein